RASAVWNSGDPRASSTARPARAGSRSSPTRFSSTSRPVIGSSRAKGGARSIAGSVSRHRWTFVGYRWRSCRSKVVRSTSWPIPCRPLHLAVRQPSTVAYGPPTRDRRTDDPPDLRRCRTATIVGMATTIEVDDAGDTRLDDYRDLTTADRRPDRPGGRGLVIAEGVVVVRRLIDSPQPVRSRLGGPRRLA